MSAGPPGADESIAAVGGEAPEEIPLPEIKEQYQEY